MVVLHRSLKWLPNVFAFWLLAHKTDTAFKGNKIIIKKIVDAPDPIPIMKRYILPMITSSPYMLNCGLSLMDPYPLRAGSSTTFANIYYLTLQGNLCMQHHCSHRSRYSSRIDQRCWMLALYFI
jgi:hypothetical protein